MAVSARVRHAARMVATGIANKREAADACGVSPSYFYVASSPKNGKEEVLELMDDVEQAMASRTMDTAKAMEIMGREALVFIRGTMLESDNEAIALKAAIDLADRSPDTSKIQKHQVESVHMSAQDAKDLAKALVEGRRVHLQFADAVAGDYVRVPVEQQTQLEDEDNGGESETRQGAIAQEHETERQRQISAGQGEPN